LEVGGGKKKVEVEDKVEGERLLNSNLASGL
jgi:hypothetical protein